MIYNGDGWRSIVENPIIENCACSIDAASICPVLSLVSVTLRQCIFCYKSTVGVTNAMLQSQLYASCIHPLDVLNIESSHALIFHDCFVIIRDAQIERMVVNML